MHRVYADGQNETVRVKIRAVATEIQRLPHTRSAHRLNRNYVTRHFAPRSLLHTFVIRNLLDAATATCRKSLDSYK